MLYPQSLQTLEFCCVFADPWTPGPLGFQCPAFLEGLDLPAAPAAPPLPAPATAEKEVSKEAMMDLYVGIPLISISMSNRNPTSRWD